jgi:NAD+ kinase
MKFFIYAHNLNYQDAVYKAVVEHIISIGSEQTFNFQDADVSIVLGGDGSVLGAARAGIKSPMLIVNTGHLGFLTSTQELFRGMIGDVSKGNYTVTQRHMLHVTHGVETLNALNDVVFKPTNHSKLIKIAVYTLDQLRGEELVGEYRADGLIVSTPTGSTAYNLSAGGPIIHPSLPAYTITPICPQGLTHRPVVLPSSFVLKIKPLELGLFMSLDGQVERPLDMNPIEVTYNSALIETINPNGSYFKILREKLAWGIKPV